MASYYRSDEESEQWEDYLAENPGTDDFLSESDAPDHQAERWAEVHADFDEWVNKRQSDSEDDFDEPYDLDDWGNWYDRDDGEYDNHQVLMDYLWDGTLDYVRSHGRSENWSKFEPCIQIDLHRGGCCEWCGEKRGQYLLLGAAGDNEEPGREKKVCGPNCPSRPGDSRRFGWYPEAGFPLPWRWASPQDSVPITTNDSYLDRLDTASVEYF